MAFTPPPGWADDTNYDAGANAWNGNPTKRAPSAGLIAKGVEPGEFLTAQHFNYLINLFSQCVEELHDAFPDTTTNNEIPRFDGTDGTVMQTSGITITDAIEVEYVTPKARNVMVSPRSFTNLNATQTQFLYVDDPASANNMKILSCNNDNTDFPSVRADVTDRLRVGMVITGVSALVKPGQAGTGSVSGILCSLESFDVNGANRITHASVASDGTTNKQTITDSSITTATVAADRFYELSIRGGTDVPAAGTVDLFFNAFISVNDVGPRSV